MLKRECLISTGLTHFYGDLICEILTKGIVPRFVQISRAFTEKSILIYTKLSQAKFLLASTENSSDQSENLFDCLTQSNDLSMISVIIKHFVIR